ncbi:endoglucanase [Clostridium neuense]|uniref:Endoglucanase n=1 Tax=Clostridium neuense TaxID=1728934 RepID=A0ABW8TLW0_9CLOT
MSMLLLIGLILLLSILFPENVDIYEIPKEFQNCPEVEQMKIFYEDRYLFPY